jgi:uncharacterized protein involved in response to NO
LIFQWLMNYMIPNIRLLIKRKPNTLFSGILLALFFDNPYSNIHLVINLRDSQNHTSQMIIMFVSELFEVSGLRLIFIYNM